MDDWLAAQEEASAAAIAAAISATHLTHTRPGFGAAVTPTAGSVLASPEYARWDPEPDYFYHWARDAGVVMMAAALLRPRDPAAWDRRFADYVAFSLRIAEAVWEAPNPWRATTDAQHARFLRADADLAGRSAASILAEPRVNADGRPDFEDWNRPQFDGPALRALSLLSWHAALPEGGERLLGLDLAHVLAHAAEPAIGPWEDPPAARHAFILIAQRAALEAGAARLDRVARAAAVDRIDAALADLWVDEPPHMRASDRAAPGEGDANVVLGALLQADPAAPFGIGDPRIAATADHVTAWSRARFPVAADAGLVGRWPGDVYFDGHPWLPTSFGFAEYFYRRAAVEPDRAALVARGDAILAAAARLFPAPGALPEQVDRDTGAPRSCRNLTWSHAAFVAALHARRALG